MRPDGRPSTDLRDVELPGSLAEVSRTSSRVPLSRMPSRPSRIPSADSPSRSFLTLIVTTPRGSSWSSLLPLVADRPPAGCAPTEVQCGVAAIVWWCESTSQHVRRTVA